MMRQGFLNIIILVIVAFLAAGAGGYFWISQNIEKPATAPETKAGQGEDIKIFDGPPSQIQENAKPKPNDFESRSLQPQEKSQTQPSAIKQGDTGSKSYPQYQQQVKVGLFGQPCEGAGSFKLKTFPIDISNIELIMPMGRVQDSHVTPTDHQYIIPIGTESGSLVTNNPKKYIIKAPADGHIIAIELFKEPVEEQYRDQPYRNNYLVLFEHSCDFYTRLIHVDTLSEKVLSSFSFKNPEDQHPYASTRIPVKEGEVVGTVGSHSFDFQIMDTNFKDKNLVSPGNIDHFSAYTVDTFNYLSDSLKSALFKKNLTKKEPLGGKIGYDIPGTLMGNWFLVGRSSARENYWTNNLSIVYDHIDPSQIRISLGSFDGYPKAFGVIGNSPDPFTINAASGAVKYELVKFDYYSDSKKWDSIHYAENLTAKNTNEIAGVVLFQLLDDRKLKVEVFPRKTVSDVIAFTGLALTYER